MNAAFQRIAKRDKKAFLSDQCKEVEENDRVGKTRDRFKKIRDTRGAELYIIKKAILSSVRFELNILILAPSRSFTKSS